MTTTYPEVLPHGEIRQIFDDIFFVTGSVFLNPQMRVSRNMIIVREGTDLTLINTVRLDDAGLRALEQLGSVRHVVKVGAFHGMDDRFYIDRYQANMWAMPDMTHTEGLETSHTLEPGAPMPLALASFFSFETSSKPEGLLVLEREGGILVSCDSLQNWATTDDYFNEAGATNLTQWGFIRPANVGPGWYKSCQPQASDFERLLALEFAHLLPSHGAPLLGTAKQELETNLAEYM